jgi:hypothetical protein
MDPLRRQVLDSIQAMTTGDPKIDELNRNVSLHIVGFLKTYEDDVARIESKRNHFTKEGLQAEKAKAREKAIQSMNEIDSKATWQKDIDEVNKKFDDQAERSDIQILTQVLREQEARAYFSNIGDIPGRKELFEAKIMSGDPVAVGAVENSFYDMGVSPKILEQGQRAMRLRSNPAAAERLEVLTSAQNTYDSMKGFFNAEIGVGGADPLADATAVTA